MAPETNPLSTALAVVAPAAVIGDGTAVTVVPYAVVRPYSKFTVVLVPFGCTLACRVAPRSFTAIAATVVPVGGGGEAATARLCSIPAEEPLPTKRSPAASAPVLTATGTEL